MTWKTTESKGISSPEKYVDRVATKAQYLNVKIPTSKGPSVHKCQISYRLQTQHQLGDSLEQVPLTAAFVVVLEVVLCILVSKSASAAS